MRRAALFAPDSSFLAVVAFAAGNAFYFLVFVILAAGKCSSHFGFVVLAAGNALLLSAVCGIRYRQCLLILALWYSVPERASHGTEYAFGAQNRLLGYATHFQRHSVQKTGVSGTEGIFGTRNPLLWYATHQDIRYQPPPLWYGTGLVNWKRVSLALYATETTWQSSFSAWLSQIPHNSHPLIRRQCDNT